jgi:isoquinoline 1-oxidoreductase beta subunit
MNTVNLIGIDGFLKAIFSAGAMVLGAGETPREASPPAGGQGGPARWFPDVYLGLEKTGQVIVIAHRSEMGTGIRTGLPMVAADELDADWSQVRVEQAIGDRKYGDQNTDGSRSMRDFYDPLRLAGATMRLMLERAAAAQWGVPVAECRAENHRVVYSPDGRSLGYGELAEAAARQPLPGREELRFKSPEEFRYIGKGVPLVDLDAICRGTAVFGTDTRLPGMVYAAIERSPVLGGRLLAYDDKDTLAVDGVEGTVLIEAAQPPYAYKALGGVAVIARNTWAAMQGRRKLKIDWEAGENGAFESAAYEAALAETSRQPQKVVRNIGDVDAEFARGGKIHEAGYYVPHLAHATMEPPAAVAAFQDGRAEIWAATQSPQDVQATVAEALGIAPADVTCHVTLLGGGFGRKAKADFVAEAAILARKWGKPVKLMWSRQEDLRFDYYHAAAAVYLKAAMDADGRPTAWLQRSVFAPIASTFDTNARYGGANELMQGLVDVPFAIPNLRAENGPAASPLRIGWLRSVANIQHAFAVQSFLDELAAAAGRDPVDYFLAVLGPDRRIDFAAEGTANANYDKPLSEYPWDTGRLRRVVEAVAEKSGWANRKTQKGRALGFAAHRSFLTYVAAVAAIEVDEKGRIRIPRLDLAVDAGRVIHPDLVRAQFEGAAVFAASIALTGEITAAKGAVQQSNFKDYPVARIDTAPYETHVHLLPSGELPTGVGEPGVPPVAPAIVNALFAATGRRIRRLPLSGHRLI